MSIFITSELQMIPEGFRYANAYVLTTAAGYTLFDPAVPPEKVSVAKSVKRLIATHGHFDHVGNLKKWLDLTGAEFWASEHAHIVLSNMVGNASLMFGRAATFPAPDFPLVHDQVYDLDGTLSLHAYNTPGHTIGSMCFLLQRKYADDKVEPFALLTGDTVFAYSWGRTDLLTGDDKQMKMSLRFVGKLLQSLPPALPVCPGHGEITTAECLLSNLRAFEVL